jgi:hypothetical protein
MPCPRLPWACFFRRSAWPCERGHGTRRPAVIRGTFGVGPAKTGNVMRPDARSVRFGHLCLWPVFSDAR